MHSLLDARRQEEHLAANQSAPILTLTMPGKTLLPVNIAGRRCTIAVELKPRESQVVRGDRQAAVCDANWRQLRNVQADAQPPELPSGKQTVQFRCTAAGESAPQVRVRFQTLGSPEPVEGN